MDLVDLEFSELGCLTGKNWSGAIFFESGAAWSPPKHALSGKRRSRRRRGTNGDFENLQICRYSILRRCS
jgi:hypothetical protein